MTTREVLMEGSITTEIGQRRTIAEGILDIDQMKAIDITTIESNIVMS